MRPETVGSLVAWTLGPLVVAVLWVSAAVARLARLEPVPVEAW